MSDAIEQDILVYCIYVCRKPCVGFNVCKDVARMRNDIIRSG